MYWNQLWISLDIPSFSGTWDGLIAIALDIFGYPIVCIHKYDKHILYFGNLHHIIMRTVFDLQ